MSAGYTGLAAEHREAYEQQMRSHERAYPGVREHALAGADSDFDEPLSAGEREHQRELRRREGMQQADVLRTRAELRGKRSQPRATRRRRSSSGRSAGPRAARAAAGAAGGALGGVTGGGGNTVMYFVGLTLGLSLIYLLVAGKGAGVLTAIVNTLVGGVRAFVAPVDPIKAAENALGAGPVSSSATAGVSPSSSGSAASTPSPGGASYVAPFSGATAGRVDQGVDFTLHPGAPIRAIGPGKVTAIIKDWFKGQPLVAYQLSSGPAAGRTIYVAEEITPSVKVGQAVVPGQVIGQYARSGTGIETGWAKPSGETLAQATTGYVEGQATAAGQSFKSFLSSLGV
jgi:murein DD-endopeptidase MepM/ murein hydrolase activator NlpD